MKKLIYSISILLGISQAATAQENRGTLIPAKVIERSILVGGSLSGAYKSINDNTGNQEREGSSQQFDFDTKVGYFFMHDFAIGIRGTVHHTRQRMRESIEIRNTNILAGPFARYYLNNGLFGEASYSMGVNNRPGRAKTDVNEIRGGVGYALFINPKVAIEPAIMLSRYKEKRPSESNSYFTEFGPSLNLGLQVYLFRERKLALAR